MAFSTSGSTSSQPAGGPASVVLMRPAAKQAIRPKTSSTRPSDKPAPVQRIPESGAQSEPSDPPAEWAQPLPSPQPRWALHAAGALQEGHHLPARAEHDQYYMCGQILQRHKFGVVCMRFGWCHRAFSRPAARYRPDAAPQLEKRSKM